MGAPGEADGAPGGGAAEGAEFDVGGGGDAGFDGHAGEQGDAEAAGDHLYEGVQAGGGEAFLFAGPAAEGERLVAQAVAVVEQEHAFGGQGGGGDSGPGREAVAAGEGDDEFVAQDRHGLGVAAVAGECDHQQVEAVAGEAVDEGAGQVLAHEQAQIGEGVAQHRHEPGQQEGADGGDDAEAEGAAERGAGGGGGFGDGFEGGQRAAGAGDDLVAEGGEDDVLAGATVEDGGVHLAFEGEDAGGEGGLGDGAGLGGTAEMAEFGEGQQVAELLRAGQRGHRSAR